MEQTPLDDILKEPQPTDIAPPETPVETEVVEERPKSRRKEHLAKEYEAQGRDPETGQFITKEPKEEVKEAKEEVKAEVKEQPKVDFSEKEKALLRAAEEERRKRQALEAELAKYRQVPPKEESEKKTFWDDPEGHLKTFEQKVAQQSLALKLQTSEQIARSRYKDFDEVLQVFGEILQSPAGPGIHAQFIAAPDPGEFAYRLGKHTKELREVGSIDAMREKIAKEERQKLEAEFKKKQEELEKQRRDLPGSLSDVKGATKKSVPVFTGPTPFEDILKP